jgi:hypothetical protein
LIELRGEAHEAAVPLDRGSETAAIARAETLLELAAKHSEILVKEYGLTETDLAGFDAAITSFSATTGRPRSTISLRTTATQSIKRCFQEGDAYLDRMDRLSLNLEPKPPDFVLAFQSARLIGAIPPRPKKAPGQATPAPSPQGPLPPKTSLPLPEPRSLTPTPPAPTLNGDELIA